jgi:hypothetical protein
VIHSKKKKPVHIEQAFLANETMLFQQHQTLSSWYKRAFS